MTKANCWVTRTVGLAGASLLFSLALTPLTSSHAGPLTFTGASGNRSASVTFNQAGGQLQVTLVNTSTADVLKPVDILTAVFFSLAGSPALGPVSAVVPSGSGVLFGPTEPGGGVGGEWAYRNLSRGPRDANQGISSAAAGGFGRKNRFPGVNLEGPVSPNGLQYGVTSAGDNPSTGKAAVTGKNALIKNSVVFLLNLPEDYTVTAEDLTSVSFQYGASMGKKKNLQAFLIPEPSTWLLVGGSLFILSLLRRRVH